MSSDMQHPGFSRPSHAVRDRVHKESDKASKVKGQARKGWSWISWSDSCSRTSTTRDVDRHQGEGLQSQSSYEQRSRHRRQRRTDLMMVSLDRLSTELELTNDALLRVTRNGSTENESLLANAGDLRRAIIRCVARIESVRRHHRRALGRVSSARGDSRLFSRSSSQLHSQSL